MSAIVYHLPVRTPPPPPAPARSAAPPAERDDLAWRRERRQLEGDIAEALAQMARMEALGVAAVWEASRP